MGTPFIAELRLFSFLFAPKGWSMCNGQLLPINQNQALFSLLGTTYGGDGRVNFGLPNLQGRIPLHMGDGIVLGQIAGEEFHALITSETPQHNHTWGVTTNVVNAPGPTGNSLGGVLAYIGSSANLQPMFAGQLSSFPGQSQPHENRQPYLTLNFCIALQGIFPSQN